MKADLDNRANILNTLMTEDRQEIRGIRAAIYNLVTYLSTASFAISAFLLGKDAPDGLVHRIALMCQATDGLILLLLWGFFVRLKKDLCFCRQCLIGRQNLILMLGTLSEPEDLDPFKVGNNPPGIRDSELWWLPALATLAIAMKSLAIRLIFA